MTGANDEETAKHSDGDRDGKTEVMAPDMGTADSPASEAASEKTITVPPPPPPDDAGAEPTANSDEEVESGVLELIEPTPVPVVVPVVASLPAQESAHRPPPLPRTGRPSESMPIAPGLPAPASPRTPFARPSVSAPPAWLGRGSSARVPVSPPLPPLGPHVVPLPAPAPAEPSSSEPEIFSAEAAIRDARKRVEQASSGDRMALARAHTELGLLLEVAAGDTAAALAEYRAAHSVSANLGAPLDGARRLTPLHPSAPALALLEADLRRKNEPGVHATRALELGMLLRASGPATEKTWQAYREVLAAAPGHPGALRGLEAALSSGSRAVESTAQMEALAAHREVMATVFRNDAHLSAWIEVERGQLLEKLGRVDAAYAAFEAALALNGEIGPVRDAYTRHLLVQGQIELLIKAWAAEATLETDGARAARLLYAAGRLASERLDQKALAIDLFERAVATEAAAASVRRVALRELFRLYEALGNHEATVATGHRLLAYARESEMAYWHRRLIPPCEALGRQGDVAIHAQHVLAAEPTDEPMREMLDRALASLGQHEQRVGIFTEQASRATASHDRIALLLRAASIAEHAMERIDLALGALRSAFASDASNADVTDAIVRLLTPATQPSLTDPEDPSRVRSRIDFYIEAAASAPDPARKIAHLEKLALIWEDEVRTPARALAVFGEILTVEPQRRSAILGLARCAARAGNTPELLRALVLEADQAGDDLFLERSLLLRAADVASKQVGDHDTALALIKRVFNHSGGDPASLRAAFHIHERAGHSAEALAQLRILLAQKNKPQSASSLQAEIARYLEERLHRPGEALTVWREAHRLEQDNPTPRAEIRRILLASGDFRAVAEEIAALGMATTNPVERAELLLDAAEIYDDRLGDAERAIPLLAEAHAALPAEMLIVDRLERAYLRTGKRTERLALLHLHATKVSDPRSQFALAALQAEDRDPSSALTRLAELSQDASTCVPALRLLEHAVRRTERWGDLDSVLRRQVEYFATVEGKLGAVFELVALEGYDNAETPEGQPPARELLAKLAPDDRLAHELFVRSEGLFRQGPASTAVIPSLRRLAATTADAMASAALHLAQGLILERQDEQHDGLQAQKEALLAFAGAEEGWPDSLAAARGAHRLALRLGDHAIFMKAAAALGTLELEPTSRATRLLEAAHMAQKQTDGATQAFEFVCRALGEDASSTAAADAVIAAVEQGQDAGKATEALRTALDRTIDPDRAVKLGAALAHIALRNLGDQTVALEALRRTRKRAPKHAGTLLALAEVSNAMGLQSEAAETATAALAVSREPTEKLRATITLAEVHVRMSAFRDSARREAHEAEKLAEEAGADGDIVARLGAVFQALGDDASAQRVLIQAVVLSSNDHSALDRLCTLFGTGREAGERVAGAIRKAMEMAESSGKPRRPEWLAALGKVEATQLGEHREGLARLHEALRLAPGHVEIYQALADAHGTAHDEAIRELIGMLGELGRSAATSQQVAGVFSILARESRQAQRSGTAAAAEELVAFFTDSSAPTRSTLMPASAPHEGALARRTLMSALVGEAHADLWDLAALLGEPIGKVLRHDPESLGVSTRDRLTSRASHPLRALADRVARVFGDLRFDLYVDARATDTPRLLDTDTPSIVLPKGFAGFSEVEQAATLARLLTYVALDVPWLDDVSNEDAEGLLFGGLRAVSELWGRGELSSAAESAAASWRPRIAKAASRKVKRGLEDLAARLRPQTDALPWGQAFRAAGLKAAYVTSGDLSATLRQTIAADPDLRARARNALPASLLAEPTTCELITFALSAAATDLRRAAGTI